MQNILSKKFFFSLKQNVKISTETSCSIKNNYNKADEDGIHNSITLNIKLITSLFMYNTSSLIQKFSNDTSSCRVPEAYL